MFVLAIGGAYGGVVTTWAVQGERVTVLYGHREDHETRLRRLESTDDLKNMIRELQTTVAVQTTKIEALEKRIAEQSASPRRR